MGAATGISHAGPWEEEPITNFLFLARPALVNLPALSCSTLRLALVRSAFRIAVCATPAVLCRKVGRTATTTVMLVTTYPSIIYLHAERRSAISSAGPVTMVAVIRRQCRAKPPLRFQASLPPRSHLRFQPMLVALRRHCQAPTRRSHPRIHPAGLRLALPTATGSIAWVVMSGVLRRPVTTLVHAAVTVA